jgi:hypothetical protein
MGYWYGLNLEGLKPLLGEALLFIPTISTVAGFKLIFLGFFIYSIADSLEDIFLLRLDSDYLS